jgi:uncharacterized membrane protein
MSLKRKRETGTWITAIIGLLLVGFVFLVNRVAAAPYDGTQDAMNTGYYHMLIFLISIALIFLHALFNIVIFYWFSRDAKDKNPRFRVPHIIINGLIWLAGIISLYLPFSSFNSVLTEASNMGSIILHDQWLASIGIPCLVPLIYIVVSTILYVSILAPVRYPSKEAAVSPHKDIVYK